jgi:hypothetical protein
VNSKGFCVRILLDILTPRLWHTAGDLGGAATTAAKWGRADQKLNAVDGRPLTHSWVPAARESRCSISPACEIRELICCPHFLAWPPSVPAQAQQPSQPLRIAIVSLVFLNDIAENGNSDFQVLFAELRRLGYIEGRNTGRASPPCRACAGV